MAFISNRNPWQQHAAATLPALRLSVEQETFPSVPRSGDCAAVTGISAPPPVSSKRHVPPRWDTFGMLTWTLFSIQLQIEPHSIGWKEIKGNHSNTDWFVRETGNPLSGNETITFSPPSQSLRIITAFGVKIAQREPFSETLQPWNKRIKHGSRCFLLRLFMWAHSVTFLCLAGI